MGNCCPKSEEIQALNSAHSSGGRSQPAVFQGEGHRLGTANENYSCPSSAPNSAPSADFPQPILDSNLTDADREKIRADRAAAAEARLKKQALPKAKKKASNDAPLRGPNSKPTMTWTAG